MRQMADSHLIVTISEEKPWTGTGRETVATVMSIGGETGFKVHFVIQKKPVFLNHATVLKVRPSTCMLLVPGHVRRFRPARSAPKGEGAAPKGRKRKGGR